jgi:PKD repeat protein
MKKTYFLRTCDFSGFITMKGNFMKTYSIIALFAFGSLFISNGAQAQYAPVASFTSDVSSGVAPLTVNFTDNSTNTPTSWSWDFGDGNTSTVQNPSNIYTSAGTFTVTLTVSNDSGSDYTTSVITVTSAGSVPIANFTPDVTTGTVPLTVNFTDNSTNSPTIWAWDFGDGNTSTLQSPSNTFIKTGTFNVTLTATNASGSSTPYTSTITVTPAGSVPVANFTPDVTSGTVPLIVNFTDNSTNSPTSWAWDFGDGNTSTLQNPSNTFTKKGAFNVTLTATNANGSSTPYSATITVMPSDSIPVASFYSDISSGDAPLKITFTDNSTNSPTSWAWDFGDGNTSTLQNPSNTFIKTGTFTVTLTATNASGSSTPYTSTILVNSSGVPVAQFAADIYSGVAPLTVNFTDQSINTPTSWLWQFGTSSSAIIQNPSYTFNSPGAYTVKLIVKNSSGTNTTSQTINVLSATALPVAKFIASVDSGNVPLTIYFTDSTSQNPTAWNWDFGDGTNSTDQNTSITYTVPGTYTVILTASNSNGSNGVSKIITAKKSSIAPIASFNTTNSKGIPPLTINFTDKSLNNPNSWNWDFGNGDVSSNQNPSYTYNTSGVFKVTLTVDNGNGTADTSVTITIDSTTARFTEDSSSGFAPLVVNFQDKSVDSPTNWEWNFGDTASGKLNNSTQQNPSFTFTRPGTYTVTLKEGNGTTFDSTTGVIQVLGDSSEILNVYNIQQNDSTVLFDTTILYTRGHRATTINSTRALKVCADGATATFFNFDCPVGVNPKNIVFRMHDDPTMANKSMYGYFNPSKYGYFGHSVYANFTSPTYLFTAFETDTFEVYNTVTGKILYTQNIKFFPAPVVFVHGLWSNQICFDDMHKAFADIFPGELYYQADYSSSADRSFAQNSAVIPNAISALFSNLRTLGYSAGSVDLVGHSMGGILSRLYIQNGGGIPVHKLVTINTPHSGSQDGDLLLSTKWYGSVLNKIFSALPNNNPNHGAVADLRTTSAAIANLNSKNCAGIPCAAITTTAIATDNSIVAGTLNVAAAFGGIYKLLGKATVNAFVSSLYNNETNDLIVALSSQQGGLNPSAISSYTNQVHMGSPANTSVIDQVIKLLDEDPAGASFSIAGWSPPVLTPYYKNPVHEFNNSVHGTVTIISPTKSLIVKPGDIIPITVASTGTYSHILLAVGTAQAADNYGYFKDSTSNHFTVNYPVPLNFVGKIGISAVAYDTTGFSADSLYLLSSTAGLALDSLQVHPKNLTIIEGSQGSLEVTGYFAGFGAIDVSHTAEVSYTSGNLKIASYDKDNLINGLTKGNTTITVSLKGKTKLVPVSVIDSSKSNVIAGIKNINNNPTNALSLKIYPNPSGGLAYITYNSRSNTPVHLTIFDINGRLLKTIIYNDTYIGDHTQILDMSGFINGVYLIQLQNGGNIEFSKLCIAN